MKTNAFLIVSLLGMAFGCSDGGDGSLPVAGTVKFADGKPVTGDTATMIFQPITTGKSAAATINPDGSFEAMTEKPGDGMQPGEYKVVLNVFQNYRDQILGVPEEYADAASTPLTAIIDADNFRFDFVVEP